jgi:hypothetical protein
VEIHLARREHHHKEFARLMRTAEELDAAATHFRGAGSFGGPQEEERSARFEDALTAYRAAYDDVEAIAPAEVRDAVTELGNAARALTRDPSYGPHMVEARDKLNRAIWRELGTDELE